ncbi:MAG TPA: 16S rRNA (cytidine(1402)-2'-O)-methyltransferase [Bacteroidota bacterium]|nr:16S rRNA (cytidine(1402)-2'-O)-methyltransferase [Bacteroidota bacterium]
MSATGEHEDGRTTGGGTLYIVATPIGNLEDISARAVRILDAVDLIAAEDTRTTRVLLHRFGISKPMVSYHGHNERSRTPGLIESLQSGRSIALVSDAGTPGISDPSCVVVREALKRGIPVVPVPGASAFLSALIASGLPTDRFVFEGFLPHKKGRKAKLQSLRDEPLTIILYESPHRLRKTLDEILELLGDRQIVIARELTKKFEEILRGRLSVVIHELRAVSPRGEYVILVDGKKSITVNRSE